MMNLIDKWINKSPQPANLYDLIGGEPVVEKLCHRFYDIMQSDPAAKELLDIHQQDLTETRLRFFEFMSGWLGGPPLFEQKYGHPRLRARHLHVNVDQTMISQWLYCINLALKECVSERTHRQAIYQKLLPLAQHMSNVG